MKLYKELQKYDSVFVDTAPFIYFVESNAKFGLVAKDIFDAFHSGIVEGFSSVITLTGILPKPVEKGNDVLVKKFTEVLLYGKNLTLMEITATIAERAGRLRGKYPTLKTVDALQIAAALSVDAESFITNDKQLKQIQEIAIVVLEDYL